MQVVPDADKGEALFQKFTHARRAKQEQPKNDVVLAGILNQFLGGRSQFRRGVHVRKLIFLIKPHRHT
jgi:hypothetical protein